MKNSGKIHEYNRGILPFPPNRLPKMTIFRVLKIFMGKLRTNKLGRDNLAQEFTLFHTQTWSRQIAHKYIDSVEIKPTSKYNSVEQDKIRTL